MTVPLPVECQRIRTSISSYFDGDLDATVCDAIEQHCQSCRRCAALVDGLRETVGLCRQAAASPLPESIRQRARESVRRLLDASTVSGSGPDKPRGGRPDS